MRLLLAVLLTAALGLAAGTLLGGAQAGIDPRTLDPDLTTLGSPAERFALARGATAGLLAGIVLGTFHWAVRLHGAARNGGKVGLFRILGGTLGFALATFAGAIGGGALGFFSATFSPEWTADVLGAPATGGFARFATAAAATRGALLAATIYSLSAVARRHRRTEPAALPAS